MATDSDKQVTEVPDGYYTATVLAERLNATARAIACFGRSHPEIPYVKCGPHRYYCIEKFRSTFLLRQRKLRR